MGLCVCVCQRVTGSIGESSQSVAFPHPQNLHRTMDVPFRAHSHAELKRYARPDFLGTIEMQEDKSMVRDPFPDPTQGETKLPKHNNYVHPCRTDTATREQ